MSHAVDDLPAPAPVPAAQALHGLAWDDTAFGPAAAWPGSLQVALQWLLALPDPAVLWWGPEFIALCNDALLTRADGLWTATAGGPAAEATPALWAALGGAARALAQTGRREPARHSGVMLAQGDGRVAAWDCTLRPVGDGLHGGILVTLIPSAAAPTLEAACLALAEANDRAVCTVEVMAGADGAVVDYRILQANPVFASLTGVAHAQGQRAGELLGRLPADWLRTLTEATRSGCAVGGVQHAPRLDRWYEFCALRLGGPGSRVAAIVFADITARRRAQDALRLREATARDQASLEALERQDVAATLGAVPVPLYACDSNALPRPLNDAAREWGGVPSWHGRWPEGHPRAGQPLQPADWPLARVLGGQPQARAVVELMDDAAPWGGPRTVLMHACALRDAAGRANGALACLVDLTDRVQAEAALRASDRYKDDFLATLAHELRNPLAPIRTIAELLRKAQPGTEALRRSAEVLARQVDLIVGLVDDITDLARISRGLIVLDRAPVALQRIVTLAVEQVRSQVDARGHRLALDLGLRPWVLELDLKRMVQVLSNLLVNAARYTPPGGRIEVRVRAADGGACIEVEDNGMGMAPETLQQVFEPFRRGSEAGRHAESGLGIGLALVRRLVELHGGTVAARSAGPGLGSVFSVWLPCGERDTPQPPTPPAARGGPGLPEAPRPIRTREANPPGAADTLPPDARPRGSGRACRGTTA